MIDKSRAQLESRNIVDVKRMMIQAVRSRAVVSIKKLGKLYLAKAIALIRRRRMARVYLIKGKNAPINFPGNRLRHSWISKWLCRRFIIGRARRLARSSTEAMIATSSSVLIVSANLVNHCQRYDNWESRKSGLIYLSMYPSIRCRKSLCGVMCLKKLGRR